MKHTLIFVYNADSGLFNTLTDIAHKLISPQTYQCNLCAITHTPFGMRKEWKDFLSGLDAELEFLHADELQARHGISEVTLPAVFRRQDERLAIWIDAAAINACGSLEELQVLITSRL